MANISCERFSPTWKTSVKQPFVTKNSKHLVGTGADDLLALIKFIPLWKMKVSNYRLHLKKLKYIVIFPCNKNKTIVTYLHLLL